MGKAMRGMMLVWAQLDNDVRSERTASGMKAAFNAGRWPWGAPIGYRHGIKNGKKTVEVVEELRPIITSLFEEAATKLYSKEQLTQKMNDRGFGRLWKQKATVKTIDKILKKKFYYGVMEAADWKMEAPGVHEAIITEDLWSRSNKAIYGEPKRVKITGKSIDFPLRHFTLCGTCLSPLRGSYSKGRSGGSYPYYHCTTKGCPAPHSWRRSDLESSFSEYLNQFTLSPVQLALLKATLLEDVERSASLHETEETKILGKINDIGNEKLDVMRSRRVGKITEGEELTMLDQLRAEESVLKVELSENKIDRSEAEAVIDFTIHFVAHVGNYWEHMKPNEKTVLQKAIFPKGVVYENGTFRTDEISSSFQLIKSFAEENSPLVTPEGIGPSISWMKARRPGPLDDGA